MFNLFSTQSKAYKNLRGTEFKSSYNNSNNAVLLDVRSLGEFSSGTIKGAKNLDITSPGFTEAIVTFDKSKKYFVFCKGGSRSAHACSVMAKHGLEVYNLAGGIGEWPA